MGEQDPTVLALHDRLLAGDPVASVDLAERFLEPLIRATRSALRPSDDEQLADDAATDALLSYAERPEQFDPSRMSLDRYLRMSARGDLRNLRAREARQRARRAPADVELAEVRGNMDSDEPQTERAEELERDALAVAHNAEEAQVLQLMLDGERSTETYAAVLGIHRRPVEEQRRVVKRTKDRLKKRLERSNWGRDDG